MKLQTKTIRVFPNPWGVNPRCVVDGTKPSGAECMDPQGRPCGVVVQDLVAGGGVAGRFVGARVCEEFTTVAQQSAHEIRSPHQRTVYRFLGVTAHETEPYQLAKELAGKEPVSLPLTPYYQDRVIEGSLIPADLASARACGIQDKYFGEPAKLMPELAKLAGAAFSAQYEDEDDAYAHFVGLRKNEAVAAAKAAKEAEELAKAPAKAPAASPPKKDPAAGKAQENGQ